MSGDGHESSHARPSPESERRPEFPLDGWPDLPDLHFDLDVIVASGDQVFTRWLVTGTYSGESTSRTPSDRLFKEYGCSLVKLGRSRIGHFRHSWAADTVP